jgi:peptide/nickel transport system permease protein
LVSLGEFLRYVARRGVGAVAVMFGVIITIFLVSHVLNPDPARLWAGARATNAQVELVRATYHLSDPIPNQLYYFIVNLFSGNLGVDPVTKQSISAEIAFYAPNTLELVVVALALTIVTGISLGYIAAMRFSTKLDLVIRLTYLVTWATPYYLGALAAILIFADYIPVFPSGGMFSLTITPPHAYTGVFLLDSLLSLNFDAFVSGLQHLILPAAVLAVLDFGVLTRVTRSSMLDVRWSTHVKSALARGVPEKEVSRRHILRNGLIDANTVSAMMFGWMLSGTVIVEQVFAWPGIGQFAYNAVVTNDYPVLIPVTIFFAFGVVIANFVADVVYSYLDPRIVLGGAG